MRQLRGLADEGSAGRNWNDTTSLVITGKAAMQFMGDWAKGEFVNAKIRLPARSMAAWSCPAAM